MDATIISPVAAASFELFRQLAVDGVVLGTVYALLGVSFTVIYSTTGIFHFAHGVAYVVAAYVAILAADTLGLPWIAAAVVGIAAAAAVGILVETGAYRPMRRAGATALGVFITALGISIAVPNLIQILFGPNNKTFVDLSPATIELGTVTFTTLDVARVVISWALIAAVLFALRRTKWGLATAAVRMNRNMAAAVGISPDRVHVLVFGVGSTLMGIAGILFVLNGNATPTMAVSPMLIAFIAAFLGGIGSIGGAAVGGLALGLVTSLSGLWVGSDYQPVIAFAALFVLLVIRPQGMFGRRAA